MPAPCSWGEHTLTHSHTHTITRLTLSLYYILYIHIYIRSKPSQKDCTDSHTHPFTHSHITHTSHTHILTHSPTHTHTHSPPSNIPVLSPAKTVPELRVSKLMQSSGCRDAEIAPHILAAPEVQLLHSATARPEPFVWVLCRDPTRYNMAVRRGRGGGAAESSHTHNDVIKWVGSH